MALLFFFFSRLIWSVGQVTGFYQKEWRRKLVSSPKSWQKNVSKPSLKRVRIHLLINCFNKYFSTLKSETKRRRTITSNRSKSSRGERLCVLWPGNFIYLPFCIFFFIEKGFNQPGKRTTESRGELWILNLAGRIAQFRIAKFIKIRSGKKLFQQ